jgi:hypothetical protein
MNLLAVSIGDRRAPLMRLIGDLDAEFRADGKTG